MSETHGICPDCRAREEQAESSIDRSTIPIGTHRVAIVRCLDTASFETLRERLRDLKLVEIIWDRRVGERRQNNEPIETPERRRFGRRAGPAPPWQSLGDLLARLRLEPAHSAPLRPAPPGPEGSSMGEAPAPGTGDIPLLEARQRLARWAEEGQRVLQTIPGTLAEQDRLRARAEAAEQECERLREEMAHVGETLRRVLNDAVQSLRETLARLRGP